MTTGSRWEHGSEFHLLSYRHKGVESSPWDKNGVFWGSGRDAFRALLLHGRAARSWRRLWIPSYFCQEVVLSLMSTGIEVAVYPDNPVEYTNGIDKIEVRPGHVILIVNFFGLRVKKQRPQYECQHVEIIEDHTHDPWSTWAWSSNADWCVVSLRKTLPVSDGGVLWSPVGQRLPPVRDVTAERRTASSYKLAAMLLKKLYLEGAPVSKEAYRRLAHFGEQHIASGEASGMAEWTPALLPTFPISAWRKQRRQNHQILTEALNCSERVKVLQGEPGDATCPFSGFLIFESPEIRDRVRRQLIEAKIYPAILWPLDKPILEGVSTEDQELSRRTLSLHCDMRYTEQDMQRVAALISRACEEEVR